MDDKVLLLNADTEDALYICDILKKSDFQFDLINRLDDLETHLKTSDFVAALLDIDSITINNREIRELTVKFPDVYFLCTSKERFHPELKEALCYHIYACIRKPVDPDELVYWLKCIIADEKEP